MSTFQEALPSAFRANIFIDWLNVKMNGGREMSFDKLFAHVRERGGRIGRANIYLPRHEGEGQLRFYDALKRVGLKLVIIEEKWKDVDCDAKMAVDMVTQSGDADVIYLLSNDAHFIPAVEYLQSAGKRVLLLHADNPSNMLRYAVDEWRHLKQVGLVEPRNGTSGL